MTLTQIVLARDHHVCAYCGQRATMVDHILSRAESRRQQISRDDEDWCCSACLACNLRRGTRRLLPPSWAERQAELEERTGKRWLVWDGDPSKLGVVLK